MTTATATRAKAAPVDEILALYRAPADVPVLVDVPSLKALCIDGTGAPAGAWFQAAVQALYSVTYTIKFGRKKTGKESGYRVMPLEGIWSGEGAEFVASAPDKWRWTLFIVQPDFIDSADVVEALAELRRKGKGAAALSRVQLVRLPAVRAAQIMHIGPYNAEQATIERLQRFVEERGLRCVGRHHEVYLGDPRRADQAKLRTLIRMAVAQ